jgi:hypothetical protein
MEVEKDLTNLKNAIIKKKEQIAKQNEQLYTVSKDDLAKAASAIEELKW